MNIVVWLTEGTWHACVDAVAGQSGDVTLLYVIDDAPGSGIQGLLGRGAPPSSVGHEPQDAAAALLATASRRLGDRRCRTSIVYGRPERAVVAACEGADLLILARDGDHSRLGPASLGPDTRFVVDHAPCRVLLVWPDDPPGLETIPPAPRHP